MHRINFFVQVFGVGRTHPSYLVLSGKMAINNELFCPKMRESVPRVYRCRGGDRVFFKGWTWGGPLGVRPSGSLPPEKGFPSIFGTNFRRILFDPKLTFKRWVSLPPPPESWVGGTPCPAPPTVFNNQGMDGWGNLPWGKYLTKFGPGSPPTLSRILSRKSSGNPTYPFPIFYLAFCLIWNFSFQFTCSQGFIDFQQ